MSRNYALFHLSDVDIVVAVILPRDFIGCRRARREGNDGEQAENHDDSQQHAH